MILYANGCSFVEGAELLKPLDSAWPTILAKKLGMQCINEGSSAGSNARIFRTTYEFIFNNIINTKDQIQEHLIVIGWTSVNRYEVYANKYSTYLKILNGRHNRFDVFPDVLSESEYKITNDFFKMYNSSTENTTQTLSYVICLLTICKQYHIPCVMFNSMRPFSIDTNLDLSILNKFKQLTKIKSMDLINRHVQYLSEQPEWCSECFSDHCIKFNFPLGPKMHPLEEAHEAWANYLYDYIIENDILNKK